VSRFCLLLAFYGCKQNTEANILIILYLSVVNRYSFGILQLYVEGYLQAMLDTTYRQEYLRVRVIDDQVITEGRY
jgi:hypothetical protein